MCLYVKKDQEFKIAKTAIVVFKHGCRTYAGGLHTTYQYASYYKDKLNPVVNVQVNDINVGTERYPYAVERGYHSFVSLLDCIADASNDPSLFVIPVGTRYIEGIFSISPSKKTRNIVSEQIVYLGSVWNPLNWLKYFKYNK